MSLFTLPVCICMQTPSVEVFDVKDQVSVACIDVSCVGRCYVGVC